MEKKDDNSGDSKFSNIKTCCLSSWVSLQECLGYCKAFFAGQGKGLLAKNEKEAAIADLQTSKMQVDATNAAEYKKKQIHDSN